jgi:REP element-mobilizing transposase RayT
MLRYKANQLRHGRTHEIGHYYMLTVATRNRSPVFGNWPMGRLLVDQFRQAQTEGLARTLAFVVMPDHFHWLVELRAGDLSSLMCKVKAKSALQVNRATGSNGPIWQRGYHDRAIRREHDLQPAARYIIYNPVRAGLVRRVQDYPLWDAAWL